MKITAEELINLMYTSMTDNRMIEAINTLGLEQPIITEEYEEEGKITISNENIAFVFKEVTGYSKDGDPVLIKIDFINFNRIKFPYALLPTDDYKTCCKKLNKKADYLNKRRLKEGKIWVVLINKIETSIVIHFEDTTFQKINYIVINKFDKDRIGKYLIPNKD